MTAEVFIDDYFNFSGANPERGDCDFLVCVYRGNERDTFYVIPYEDMPREGAKIRAVDHDGVSLDNGKSRYSQFKKAWYLFNGVRGGNTRKERRNKE